MAFYFSVSLVQYSIPQKVNNPGHEHVQDQLFLPFLFSPGFLEQFLSMSMIFLVIIMTVVMIFIGMIMLLNRTRLVE